MFFRAAVACSLVYLYLLATSAVDDDPPPPPVAVETRIVDVRRDEVARLVGDPGAARVVPALRDGAPAGVKLFGIRPGSPLAAIGLENGDTVRAIDDVPMSSPGAALEVYRLQAAPPDHLDLDVERRGQPVRIVVLLH
jgi:type II secretory pathway component PulC